MNQDDWNLYCQWKQGWNNFNSDHLFFVTDENLLLDNIEKQLKASNYEVELAKSMLTNIGVKV
jgi:hypothetical protein